MSTEKDKSGESLERESEVADEMESEMEDRDEARIEGERAQREDLNQGMSTGTYDSTHRGVDWPASYTVHDKAVKPKQSPDDQKSDTNSKS